MDNRRNNISRFEDISSSSRQRPERRPDTAYGRPNPERRPARSAEERRALTGSRPPQKRPPPSWEVPDWELTDRNRRPRATPERRPARPPERRPVQPRKRSKKPISRGARKALSALVVLIMAGATALLAIFLLFKVTDIKVTGDVIDGCQNSQIIEICGYKTGDNLIFISTCDREERLKAQLPYIGEAEISRHLPGTIEINLKAAQVSACVAVGSEWLYVNADGKILEKNTQPKEDVLQISGLTPLNSQPGEFVTVEDDNAQAAYTTVLSALDELGMIGEFTELDISDLSNITILYQDRIEFKLGIAVELKYKMDLGCRSVAELGSGEKGVMDLSYADETKRAIFTAGAINADKTDTDTGNSVQPDEPAPDNDNSASSSSGRGDDIPDEVFTGGDD